MDQRLGLETWWPWAPDPGLENGIWPWKMATSDYLMMASPHGYPLAEQLTYQDILPLLSSIEDGSPHSSLNCR